MIPPENIRGDDPTNPQIHEIRLPCTGKTEQAKDHAELKEQNRHHL